MRVTIIYDEGPFAGRVSYDENDPDIVSDENKKIAWGHYALFKRTGIGTVVQGMSQYARQNIVITPSGAPTAPGVPHRYEFYDHTATDDGVELRCRYLGTIPPSNKPS